MVFNRIYYLGYRKKTDSIIPFKGIEQKGEFFIYSDIARMDTHRPFYVLFKKWGYSGNGYCWEGHIIQIIRQEDKALLKLLEFESETEKFWVKADSSQSQSRFMDLMNPIFSNHKKLEVFIKTANPLAIDD